MSSPLPHPVDRIDDRGNIREHLTVDGRRTLCGIEIGMRQGASMNARCRRCDSIRQARRHEAVTERAAWMKEVA
jgi:hypothetical protein